MSWIWRALVFVLVFTLDVRVKAESVSLPNAAHPTQEPAGCALTTTGLCALATGDGEKFRFPIASTEITLDSSSSVIRSGSDELTLVKGTVWVRSSAESPFRVRTEYGQALIPAGSDVWVSKTQRGERMVVAVTRGSAELRPRGSGAGEVMGLDAGEENWLGPVDSTGRATSGIPIAIYVPDLLRLWARLYSGTRKQFAEEVVDFQRQWSRNLASLASVHAELAERKREMIRQEDERKAQVQAREAAHRSELRAMFRRKTLLD